MAPAGWLIVFLVFLGAELFWRRLVSLWFAAGALAAWGGAWLGFSAKEQLIAFAAVSAVVLIMIRPLSFLAWHLAGREEETR